MTVRQAHVPFTTVTYLPETDQMGADENSVTLDEFDDVAPTSPFRPHIADLPNPRRRWILHWVPRIVSLSLESIALIIVLCALPYGGNTAALVTSVVLIAAVVQTRRQQLTLSVLDDLPRVAMAISLTTGACAIVLAPSSTIGEIGLMAGGALTAIVVARNVAYFSFRRMRKHERFQRRTVVIGGGTVATQISSSMSTYPEHGLRALAMLDDSPTEIARSSDTPVEPLSNQLRGYLQTHDIDTVVIAFSSLRESAMLAILRECDRMDCEVFVVPRLFEYVSVTGDMDRLHAIPLMRIRRDVHRSLAWRFKRFTSMFIASAALLVLLPFITVIALGVWLSDRSAPILFRQTRVSIDGTEFVCLKFRSMKPESSTESDTTWSISKDDRVGRFGRFIRKTSIDELPQLWNVLVGDMHLVGPRPERPHFVERFNEEIPGYAARHRIPGGLTGWAAVHGLRGDTSLKDRALYDNFYIENWSLWLDAKIILRTFLSVLKRTGG